MPVAEGTFVAAAVRNDRPLAKRLEAAMSAAVTAAHAEGITDPDLIKERMMAAYRAERARG
jgi:hypothetical protein